ncbi:hypothetical protein ACLB2K_031360 [Fragaria x ananassa]
MRLQGIKGPSYRLHNGNTKEISNMQNEALSRPIDVSDDICSHVQPHIHAWTKTYGRNFLQWYGVQPVLVVTEPELCKEILNNKDGVYPKQKPKKLGKKLLGDCISMADGEKWVKLRKVSNHAFHGDSLNVSPLLARGSKKRGDAVVWQSDSKLRWPCQSQKRMSMIMNETLRLYPPAVLIVRKVAREVRLGNLLLPANMELLFPPLAIHHEAQFWGQVAGLFKPDRLSEGAAKATNDNMAAFMPFGMMGPRMCVGFNFATAEIKIALSMILQRHSFTPSPGYVHSPFQFMTLRPLHRVHEK